MSSSASRREAERVEPEVVPNTLPPMTVKLGQGRWMDGSTITVMTIVTPYGTFDFKMTGDMARQLGDGLLKIGGAAASGLILAGSA